ncbi:Phage terminase, small subunit [Lachnospiraceae bacterium TWA4]|nr:Phage terminase, small subunit [Lachnospiraceae bacterium TWA4]
MAKGLTDKQKRFVEEYLIDLNATQACIRAGYKSSEYTDTNANKLLENTSVREAIQKELAKRSKRTGINQDRVVQELARIAFVKITDVVDADGEINRDASPDDLACIEGYKVKNMDGDKGSSFEREVKLASKLKALELLGKHLGMFNDKLQVEVTQPVFGGEDELEE